MTDLFKDVISSLNTKSGNQFELDPTAAEKAYAAFVVNRNFSMTQNSLFFAQEMNRFGDILPNRLQYDFYYHGLPKAKRFAKWAKKESDEDVDLLKEFYRVSEKKAREYLRVLSSQDITDIRSRLQKGGISK